MGFDIPIIGLRGFQLLFSFVIIGLSVTLMKGHKIGDAPVTTTYSIFTGAFGAITAVVCLAALWVDAIKGIIVMAIDALTALFYIAGGIVSFLLHMLPHIVMTSHQKRSTNQA